MGRVFIVAEDGAGRELTGFALEHGDDPAAELATRGLRSIRPVDATGAGGDLVIRMLAEPDPAPDTPATADPPRDDDVPADATTVRRQRVAAYAWVESSRGILAAEFYRPTPGGRWGLAGGGLDPQEQPIDAVHREVMEETSQAIDLGDLVAVNTRHWIGRNMAGVVEDFHAVQLIYRATCPEPTDPIVIDVGGTTSAAAWFPYETWQDQPWNAGWRPLLINLFG
jgi:8-oxo-dGTP diphosphatase